MTSQKTDGQDAFSQEMENEVFDRNEGQDIGDQNTAENQPEEPAREETKASQETEAEDEDTILAGEGKEKEKKGLFKKKEKKDPRDEKIEELTDRLMRNMAEFDNYRKRTDKEKSAMYEIGAKDIIEKILPVVDNFERGLAAVSEAEKGSPLAEGMEKIYKQLIKTLEDMGVTVIEAAGKEFDPNFHNAVMHIEDENFGENIVSMELQKGYMYRDSVVRHSMVQVAN